MRAISTDGLEPPESIASGPVPLLQWIEIKQLVVNPSYQRDLSQRSCRSIQRIAEHFNWSFFAPVVVSAAEGGRFAIIDGQHRTTAAALCGFESVPCQIIVADEREQAASFAAINASTTAVTPLALYNAALAAGEDWAVEVDFVCACAEVEVLRHPVAASRRSAGQIVAVTALRSCLKRYGRDTLITALQCITQTSNNKARLLDPLLIAALCEVLDAAPQWRDSGLMLFQAFDMIDLEYLMNKLPAGVPRRERPLVLAGRIMDELSRALLPVAAE